MKWEEGVKVIYKESSELKLDNIKEIKIQETFSVILLFPLRTYLKNW